MELIERAFVACDIIRPIRSGGLPVFRLDRFNDTIFYAPGYVGLVPLSQADQFETMIATSDSSSLAGLGRRLQKQATAAMATRQRWQTASFRPECLTLYLSNQCNLCCSYCYANATPVPTLNLELNVIRAAARLVAESCHQKNCPFTLVLHGGGEPTLDKDLVEQVLRIHDEVARECQVSTFRYIATNGVMPADKARWLAQCFDRVGLSCDGPADIQNQQRPRWRGGPTSPLVEQTARILRDQGCPFEVRGTVTRLTVQRQSEIVDYLGQQLLPAAIHMEPVYAGGRAGQAVAFEAADAADFVTHFWLARRRAARLNIPLLYAGSRLGTIHGPYCQLFRNVLHLIPGGVATACFKVTTSFQANQAGVIIGGWDKNTSSFILDEPADRTLRQTLTTPAYASCRHCFNQFHCVGECPDHCGLAATQLSSAVVTEPGFRCRVQKALAMTTLLETVDTLSTPELTSNRRNGNHADACGTALV